MHAERPRRRRWIWAAGGALLFGLVFFGALALSLPSGTVLGLARSALAGTGLSLEAREARLSPPFGIRLADAAIGPAGGSALRVDAVAAGWEITGLFRGLPGHVSLARGPARIDVRTSPAFWRPGRIRARAEKIGPADLSPLFPAGTGLDFFVETADFAWRRGAGDSSAGTGSASLARLLVPIPMRDSPVREALLTDVHLRFTLRGGTIQVYSLTGMYEGAKVEGTGEIAGFAVPSRSRVTFHLKIHNPLEGKVAALFDLVSKNAKNANLRVTGTLLAPEGRFEFF